MSEHATIDLAADEIENAAFKRGIDAGRIVLSRQLDRRQSPSNLDFNARLCTELRERDLRRRNNREPALNLWRI